MHLSLIYVQLEMAIFDDALEERLMVSQMITPTLLNKGERVSLVPRPFEGPGDEAKRESALSLVEGLAPRLDSTTDKGGGEGLETTVIRVFLFFRKFAVVYLAEVSGYTYMVQVCTVWSRTPLGNDDVD